ncbi:MULTISPECIES: hypothetical protein [Rhizobium]|uniref:hypothetical protein n=2 Tax=Rhizobium/Agrobacterium group TaxID=227290 RepID=UPI00115D563A|nr:hypothetical protein J5274_23790 [Rhizobium sp. L51/94]QXZ87312.1 hypothetical protein J5287_22475 [Rhizobium sp. K1/93]QYA04127.1 hypothetical protein J5278_25660 [Rhizobium sp. B21/90]TQX86791.1 hypothetical protein EQW76_16690 [Rhizobium sp. rho-13.1]TQY11401.1 hypothetical protein EQW74_18005 [Rhizobium sp. rho-1.1]
MSRERIPAGNILALGRSREDRAKDVEETATFYMPTNVDLGKLMPEEPPRTKEQQATVRGAPQQRRTSGKNVRTSPSKEGKNPPAGSLITKRKRISLYLDDDVLTKIFRVSLERHEQLSSATHRLILEALQARGL